MAGKDERLMDLTEGRPVTRILLFSVPLVLGTLFQQLYSFADTVMVGRLIGANALAAVGSTYSLNFLTLGFIQGTCVGFGIPLAQAFGAKRRDEWQRFWGNGCFLCCIMAVLFTLSMTLLASPLLAMIRTPEEIFSDAVVYIQVIFIGIPANILYNYCSSALRAAGDSRRPFYFLLFSSLLNIGLDYVFIVPVGLGVAGAALATILSQLVSGLLNLWWLLRRTDLLAGFRENRSLSAAHMARLCIVGFPMGFEYSVSAIGAVVMQGAVNTLGTAAVAGQTAGEKIRQMFTLPMESVGMAMATYVGQNQGAGRVDRIRKGIAGGLWIQAVYCAAAWAALFAGGRAFTGLVLGADSPQASALSVQYLAQISPLFLLHGALMIFRNTLQGMGYSLHAVASGVGELLGRSLGAALAVCFMSFSAISYSNPLAWGCALAYCVWMCGRVMRRQENREKLEKKRENRG